MINNIYRKRQAVCLSFLIKKFKKVVDSIIEIGVYLNHQINQVPNTEVKANENTDKK